MSVAPAGPVAQNWMDLPPGTLPGTPPATTPPATTPPVVPAPEPPKCTWDKDPFPLMGESKLLPCPWQQWSLLGGLLCFLMICCCIIISIMLKNPRKN